MFLRLLLLLLLLLLLMFLFDIFLVECVSPTARPDVQLTLGSNLMAANIKEGDDVYFDCRASALPPVTRLEWFHNVSCNISIIELCVWTKKSLHKEFLTLVRANVLTHVSSV